MTNQTDENPLNNEELNDLHEAIELNNASESYLLTI
jgi:hypothetical protein